MKLEIYCCKKEEEGRPVYDGSKTIMGVGWIVHFEETRTKRQFELEVTAAEAREFFVHGVYTLTISEEEVDSQRNEMLKRHLPIKACGAAS